MNNSTLMFSMYKVSWTSNSHSFKSNRGCSYIHGYSYCFRKINNLMISMPFNKNIGYGVGFSLLFKLKRSTDNFKQEKNSIISIMRELNGLPS